jgi:hypothetical protein
MPCAWHQNIKRSPAIERTSTDGIVFDSKAELRRWGQLKMLQQAGEISNLTRQQEFPLAVNGRAVKIRSAGFPNGQPCTYHVDFTYTETSTGKIVYEEVKGYDERESRLRRAVVEALYGIEITVTGPAAKATPRKAQPARGESAGEAT